MSDTAATKTDLDRLFKKPLQPAPMNPDEFEPSVLYHYTGAIGLKGILSDLSLWATNFSFLNDPSEVKYGRKLVIKTLKHQGQQLPDIAEFLEKIEKAFVKYAVSEVYVCCFTKCRDDLSQWRSYGAPMAARYSIGFDLNAIREWAEAMPEVLFKELIYEKPKQQEEIMWLIRQALTGIERFPSDAETIANLVADHLARLLPLLKSPAYFGEKEWRVIRWIPNAKVSEVSFDAARGVIRPYVPLKKSPVVELLVLAPGRERQSAKAADMLLLKAGIENVKSEPSQVPFAE